MKTLEDNNLSTITHQFRALTPDQIDAVLRVLRLVDQRIKAHQMGQDLDKADQQLVVLGLCQSRLEVRRVIESVTRLAQ